MTQCVQCVWIYSIWVVFVLLQPMLGHMVDGLSSQVDAIIAAKTYRLVTRQAELASANMWSYDICHHKGFYMRNFPATYKTADVYYFQTAIPSAKVIVTKQLFLHQKRPNFKLVLTLLSPKTRNLADITWGIIRKIFSDYYCRLAGFEQRVTRTMYIMPCIRTLPHYFTNSYKKRSLIPNMLGKSKSTNVL